MSIPLKATTRTLTPTIFTRKLNRRTLLSTATLLLPPVAQAKANSEIEAVLENPEWPEEFPFRTADFRRFDETVDTEFYSTPRFVTHIDDAAIAALTQYYSKVFPKDSGASYLDLCSSWISHYPKNLKAKRIAGLGMNAEELARNGILTEYVVHDLNLDPKLPYDNNAFDVITNAVSVDYLSKPIEIFREMHRVLKPGGLALMSFSNRCFPTKVIQIWGGTGDADHVMIVGSYFHYAVKDGFQPPKCADISPNAGIFGRSDPMYVVYSRKVTDA